MKKEISEAAHWVLITKSGVDDLNKCIQVKKWKKIGRKSNFWMFDINISSAIREYTRSRYTVISAYEISFCLKNTEISVFSINLTYFFNSGGHQFFLDRSINSSVNTKRRQSGLTEVRPCLWWIIFPFCIKYCFDTLFYNLVIRNIETNCFWVFNFVSPEFWPIYSNCLFFRKCMKNDNKM